MGSAKRLWNSLDRRWKEVFILLLLNVLLWVLLTVVLSLPRWGDALCWGTLALIDAALVSDLTEKWGKRGHRILRSVAVSILVATAGLLTTWGWDARNSYYDDREQLVAVAVELARNQAYFLANYKSAKSAGEGQDSSISPCFYNFDTSETRRSITENQMVRKDRDLAISLHDYISYFDRANEIIDRSNRMLSDPKVFSEKVLVQVGNSLTKKKTALLPKVANRLLRLESVLERDYKWALTQAEEVDVFNLLEEESPSLKLEKTHVREFLLNISTSRSQAMEETTGDASPQD